MAESIGQLLRSFVPLSVIFVFIAALISFTLQQNNSKNGFVGVTEVILPTLLLSCSALPLITFALSQSPIAEYYRSNVRTYLHRDPLPNASPSFVAGNEKLSSSWTSLLFHFPSRYSFGGVGSRFCSVASLCSSRSFLCYCSLDQVPNLLSQLCARNNLIYIASSPSFSFSFRTLFPVLLLAAGAVGAFSAPVFGVVIALLLFLLQVRTSRGDKVTSSSDMLTLPSSNGQC